MNRLIQRPLATTETREPTLLLVNLRPNGGLFIYRYLVPHRFVFSHSRTAGQRGSSQSVSSNLLILV